MRIAKTLTWVAVAVFGTLVALTIAAAAGSRTEPLRKLVVSPIVSTATSNCARSASIRFRASSSAAKG
jgi:hypothetical protein